jgi:hypothetical protein
VPTKKTKTKAVRAQAAFMLKAEAIKPRTKLGKKNNKSYQSNNSAESHFFCSLNVLSSTFS